VDGEIIDLFLFLVTENATMLVDDIPDCIFGQPEIGR